MKSLKVLRGEPIQREGGEEFKCYMIRQMMMAVLHSNGQLRTEKDGDTYRKRTLKPALYGR